MASVFSTATCPTREQRGKASSSDEILCYTCGLVEVNSFYS